MTTIKLHRYTAVILLVFAILHFATHLSGLWGMEAYNQTQAFFRLIYKNVIVEPILLFAFIVQIWFGCRLLWKNWKRLWRTQWGRTQAISGAIFLYFITQHLIGFAIARWIDGLDTNMYWPLSVMSGLPFAYYFFVYYFLGVTAFFVHVGCAARLIAVRRSRKGMGLVAFWGLSVIGGVLGLTINEILFDVAYDVYLPDEWLHTLTRVYPDVSFWK